MAKTLSEQRFIQHNFAKAEPVLRQMAGRGNPRGLYCLGELLMQKALFGGWEAAYKEGMSLLFNGFLKADPLCFMAYIRHDERFALRFLTPEERKEAAGDIEAVLKQTESLVKKIHRMASAGDPLAMMEYAAALASGIGVTRNMEEAETWLKKSADCGYWNAMLRYSAWLMRDKAKDRRKEAFDYTRQAALMGDGLAEIRLGDCYHFGLGCEKSFEEARKCYSHASRRGSVNGVLSMARLYDDRSFSQRSDIEAAVWTEKAAQMGNTDAMCVMGDRFFYGVSVAKDMKKATMWYDRAARAGSARGVYSVGKLSILGHRYKQGTRLMEQAVRMGWQEGRVVLALMYLEGLGVQKNKKKGKTLLHSAAGAGVAEARRMVKTRHIPSVTQFILSH